MTRAAVAYPTLWRRIDIKGDDQHLKPGGGLVRHLSGVATQVSKGLLGATERTLDVDDPALRASPGPSAYFCL